MYYSRTATSSPDNWSHKVSLLLRYLLRYLGRLQFYRFEIIPPPTTPLAPLSMAKTRSLNTPGTCNQGMLSLIGIVSERGDTVRGKRPQYHFCSIPMAILSQDMQMMLHSPQDCTRAPSAVIVILVLLRFVPGLPRIVDAGTPLTGGYLTTPI